MDAPAASTTTDVAEAEELQQLEEELIHLAQGEGIALPTAEAAATPAQPDAQQHNEQPLLVLQQLLVKQQTRFLKVLQQLLVTGCGGDAATAAHTAAASTSDARLQRKVLKAVLKRVVVRDAAHTAASQAQQQQLEATQQELRETQQQLAAARQQLASVQGQLVQLKQECVRAKELHKRKFAKASAALQRQYNVQLAARSAHFTHQLAQLQDAQAAAAGHWEETDHYLSCHSSQEEEEEEAAAAAAAAVAAGYACEPGRPALDTLMQLQQRLKALQSKERRCRQQQQQPEEEQQHSKAPSKAAAAGAAHRRPRQPSSVKELAVVPSEEVLRCAAQCAGEEGCLRPASAPPSTLLRHHQRRQQVSAATPTAPHCVDGQKNRSSSSRWPPVLPVPSSSGRSKQRVARAESGGTHQLLQNEPPSVISSSAAHPGALCK